MRFRRKTRSPFGRHSRSRQTTHVLPCARRRALRVSQVLVHSGESEVFNVEFFSEHGLGAAFVLRKKFVVGSVGSQKYLRIPSQVTFEISFCLPRALRGSVEGLVSWRGFSFPLRKRICLRLPCLFPTTADPLSFSESGSFPFQHCLLQVLSL